MSEVISDSQLEEISKSYCGKWRHLPPHLGLGNIVKDDIDHNPGDERKKRYDFLVEWKNRKGSDATYSTLVAALEKIDCKEDAEYVKKLMTSLSPPGVHISSTQTKASDRTETDSDQSSEVPSLKLSEKIKQDLRQQLERNLNQIGRHYASYVSCICTSLIEKGVTATSLTTYLLKLPCLKFGPDEEHLKLLAGVRNELLKAKTIDDIINLLDENLYASHLDYEVFQAIVDKYKLSDEEILGYPDHLKTYVEKHKLSEFIAINPALSKMCTSDSEEITLKFEIDPSNYKLGSLLRLKRSISDILGIKSSGLRLLRVEEGCVAMTFIIPYFVAHHIFNLEKKFTDAEVQQFLGLSTMWLKCCDRFFDFKYDDAAHASIQQHNRIEQPNTAEVSASAEAATSTQEFQDNIISEQQDEISRLNKNYQKLLEAHQRLTESFREQNSENRRLNQQIADLTTELHTLHHQSSPELQRVLDAQKSELEQLKLHQIPALRQSIEAKNQKITAVREELESKVAEIKGLVAIKRIVEEKVFDLKKDIRAYQEEILFYKSILEQKCDKHEHYDFVSYKKSMEHYEKQLKEVNILSPYSHHPPLFLPILPTFATSIRKKKQQRRTPLKQSALLNLGVFNDDLRAQLKPLNEKEKSIEAKIISRYELSYEPENRGRHTLTVEVSDDLILHCADIFVEHPVEMIRSPHQTIHSLPGASHVAVHKKKNMLFTSDSINHKYHVYDLSSNTLIQSIACEIEIRGIAVDTEGNVYLTSKHWLYKYSASGERVGAVGSDQPPQNEDASSFNNLTGIGVSSDQIYICSTDTSRVLVFNSALDLVTKFGHGLRHIQLKKPKDIAFGPGYKCFVLDAEMKAVIIYESRIYSQAICVDQLQKPEGLCYRNNHIFVTDSAGQCFGIYKLTGEFLHKIDFNGTPAGICTDADGYIYIANTTDNTVVVY